MYDAINCGAAAKELPENLLNQLKPGGRMVLPLGQPGKPQWLSIVDKALDGEVSVTKFMLVIFVPLTTANDQLENPLRLLHPDVVNTKA